MILLLFYKVRIVLQNTQDRYIKISYVGGVLGMKISK